TDNYWVNAISGRAGLQLTPQLSAQIVGFFNNTSLQYDSFFPGPDDPLFPGPDSSDFVHKQEGGAAAQVVYEATNKVWRNELTASTFRSTRNYNPGSTNDSLSESDYDGKLSRLSDVLNFRPSRIIGIAAGVDYEREASHQIGFGDNLDASVETKSGFA